MRLKTSADRMGLCGNCENATVIRYKDGTAMVFCSWVHPPMRMTKPVESCTDYREHNTLDRHELEKVAWTLRTEKGGRVIGFEPPKAKED